MYEESTEYTVAHKAFEEGVKLNFEASKHLTTLNTGAILIILTLFERMFNDKSSAQEMIAALILFLVSIVVSVLTMIALGSAVRDVEFQKKYGRNYAALIMNIIAVMCFVSGIVCLAFSVISNVPTK